MIKIEHVVPQPGWLIVKPMEAEEQTKSGIILPASDEQPSLGEVISVGPRPIEGMTAAGISLVKIPFNPGDQVVFKHWGRNEITIDDKKYFFFKFEEIMGVVRKESKELN